MTPLTQCQTQHTIPAIRETAVAAAHAEAKTVILTKTKTVATAVVIANLAVTAANPKAVAKMATVPRNSVHKLPARRALTPRQN